MLRNGHLEPVPIVREVSISRAELIQKANRAWSMIVKRNEDNLATAKELGEMLLSMKKKYGTHGSWKEWINKNTQVPYERASCCMRIAEWWDELEEAKVDTFTKALHYIRAKRIEEKGEAKEVKNIGSNIFEPEDKETKKRPMKPLNVRFTLAFKTLANVLSSMNEDHDLEGLDKAFKQIKEKLFEADGTPIYQMNKKT